LLNIGSVDGQRRALEAREASGENIVELCQGLRPRFQLALLGWIRGDNADGNLRKIGEVGERLENAAVTAEVHQLWWVVGGVIEALLEGGLPEKVLEVGTGSGYQAAVLSHLVKQVYTVERIKELLRLARRRFHTMSLHNIHSRYADGHLGWPTQAPFDGIIITAASQVIPEKLLEQLSVGAKLVMPLEQNNEQRLLSITRTDEGFEETDLGAVVFVPMLSGLA